MFTDARDARPRYSILLGGKDKTKPDFCFGFSHVLLLPNPNVIKHRPLVVSVVFAVV